jgi:type II secretory pathway pseudopilin PulG
MKTLLKIAIVVMILTMGVSWTWALTTEEVIKLKKAGVSDETIRLMIEQERAAKERNPSDQIGVREVKDAEGNTSVIYSTGAPTAPTQGGSEQEKVEKAWKMLENQNMIIDNRRPGK